MGPVHTRVTVEAAMENLCRLPHSAFRKPVSAPSHLKRSGAWTRQVAVEKRSPEASSPSSPSGSWLPLHRAAPVATCSGSSLTRQRPAVRGPGASALLGLRRTHWAARQTESPPVGSRRPPARTRLVAPFRAGVGRAGVRFKLQDTHTPLPHRTRRQGPFLAARTLSLSGPPKLGPRPSPFRAAPGPSSAEPQVARRERSSRRSVALYVPALRPSRPRPSPVPRPGRRNPRRQTHSGAARLPAGPRRRPRRWRPPALLFPLPSGRVPPTPARGLGTAPVAPGRLARPLSSCLARRGASGVRRRRG